MVNTPLSIRILDAATLCLMALFISSELLPDSVTALLGISVFILVCMSVVCDEREKKFNKRSTK